MSSDFDMATINKFKQIENIFPKINFFTGTVAAHNSDGTSTITLTNGGLFVADGQTVPVGQIAFIKGSHIGQSVVLSSYNLEV